MRELHAVDVDSLGGESFGVPERRLVSGVVRVVGDADAADFLREDRLEEFVREPLAPVAERHVSDAVDPKRQRVERRLAQDHVGLIERFKIPNAFVRAGQVQVKRGSRFEPGRDLPSVHFDQVSGFVEDRHRHRAGHQLVSALAQDAELFKPRADRLPVLPVLRRKSQTQRPVREPEPELFDGLVVLQAAFLQVRQRRGRFL